MMKLLKNEAAWKRWAVAHEKSQPQAPHRRPRLYPCIVYLIVGSFGMEEELARYLYLADIERMRRDLKKHI